MRLLANPIFVRMALALVASLAAFAMAILAVRFLRHKLVEEEKLPENLSTGDAQYAYSAVIQQLKQQKFELQNEQDAQRKRAKASEHITSAVISNLPCGVLLIGPRGLVRQANAAARQLLGFASPLGMSPEDLFRDTLAVSDAGDSVRFADAMRQSLREQIRGNFSANYQSSNAEQRNLSLALIPLALPLDEALGLACVIADDTAASRLRQEQVMQKEIAAEMALELRRSLSIIRDCAGRFSEGQGREAVQRVVEDIAHETDRLNKVVGNFLAGSEEDLALAARA